MDAAVLTPTHIPQLATGVEICKCPPEYNSTSCQDPSIGYYRWYKNTTVTSTIVIDLVGEAKACQCNGRSNICNIETGYCLNCRGNTAGQDAIFARTVSTGMPTWLQTVPLPASGQKIFEYLHDSRQHGADLRLQTWLHREEMRAMLARILRIPSSARWKMHAVRMQPAEV
uniref:Laminin subunit alpha-5-like protein n=1 Tax=Apis cerana TaxID=7461 RepID=V9IG82_APICE